MVTFWRGLSYFRRGDQNAQRKGKLRRHSEERTKRGRYNSTIFALCDVLDFVKKFVELDNAISDFYAPQIEKRDVCKEGNKKWVRGIKKGKIPQMFAFIFVFVS